MFKKYREACDFKAPRCANWRCHISQALMCLIFSLRMNSPGLFLFLNDKTKYMYVASCTRTCMYLLIKRLICVFIIRIWHKQVLSWGGSIDGELFFKLPCFDNIFTQFSQTRTYSLSPVWMVSYSYYKFQLFIISSSEPKARKVSLSYTNGPPSVRRRPRFWTWISLRPVGQSWSNFMCSITGVGETLHKVLGAYWIKTLVFMATESAHWLIKGKTMSPSFLCCFWSNLFQTCR